MKIEKIEERIKAIEAVIAELPEDYQPFGFFLRLSGARTENALGVTVSDIESTFSGGYTPDLHLKFLVDALGGVLSANAVDYLLKYVVTCRKAILERRGLGRSSAPSQAFIDREGVPLKRSKVFVAFRVANAKLGQKPFIGPREIQLAVAAAYVALERCRHRNPIMTVAYIRRTHTLGLRMPGCKRGA